jgi:hypothetical protein
MHGRAGAHRALVAADGRGIQPTIDVVHAQSICTDPTQQVDGLVQRMALPETCWSTGRSLPEARGFADPRPSTEWPLRRRESGFGQARPSGLASALLPAGRLPEVGVEHGA